MALPSALVMGMDANGLGVARALGRQGVPVIGLDDRSKIPGFKSRYVKPRICPDVMSEPDSVLEMLLGIGSELGHKAVLFPTTDAFALFLSRQRNQLSQCYDFNIPPVGSEELIVNKRRQYEEAEKLGIPIAEVFYPRHDEDVADIAAKAIFPAFIKPTSSHLWSMHFANKGFIVRNRIELREKMAKVLPTGLEVMVQAIMTPPSKDLYSVGAYFGKDGYISPSITWHKLRQYPPNFGVGSLVESVHQPDVEELGLRYLKGIGYQGIGYVEFKKDQRDGRWKMVELNARTGQTNALQEAAGMSLPLIAYTDITGGDLTRFRDYQDGVLWWNGLCDLDSCWRLWRRGEERLGEWPRSFLACDVHAYFAFEDMMPALRRYGYGVELARKLAYLFRMMQDEDMVYL